MTKEFLPSDQFQTDEITSTPESGQKVPLQQTIAKLLDVWFRPTAFEQNLQIYERLGVKLFKKYIPTSGDLVHRLIWKRFDSEDFIKPTISSLEGFNNITKVVEALHVTSFLLYDIVFLTFLSRGIIDAAVTIVILNTLMNIYPIFVQRYNRVRIHNAMDKMRKRTVEKKPID